MGGSFFGGSSVFAFILHHSFVLVITLYLQSYLCPAAGRPTNVHFDRMRWPMVCVTVRCVMAASVRLWLLSCCVLPVGICAS